MLKRTPAMPNGDQVLEFVEFAIAGLLELSSI